MDMELKPALGEAPPPRPHAPACRGVIPTIRHHFICFCLGVKYDSPFPFLTFYPRIRVIMIREWDDWIIIIEKYKNYPGINQKHQINHQFTEKTKTKGFFNIPNLHLECTSITHWIKNNPLHRTSTQETIIPLITNLQRICSQSLIKFGINVKTS